MKMLFLPIAVRTFEKGLRYLLIKNEIAKTAAHAKRLLAISGSPLPKSHLTSQNERKVIINHAQIAVTAMKHTILTAMFKFLMRSLYFLNRYPA